MRHPRRLAAALLAIAAAAPLAACPAAAAQNQKRMPDAPLDFDPARPEPVEGWWTNGSDLLRLERNGAYQLWITQDRFKRPAEVGAWRRKNYVFFDLEPYRAKPGTRRRVNLGKVAGATELQIDGMKSLRAVSEPPHVPADDMLGAWIAPTEQLLVMDNGRYEWRRVGPATGITEHSGAWNSEGDVLTLAPDTTAVNPVSLRCVRRDDGSFALESPGGRMTHPPTVPDPAGSAPTAPVAPGTAPAPGGKPAPGTKPAPANAPASGNAPASKPTGNG